MTVYRCRCGYRVGETEYAAAAFDYECPECRKFYRSDFTRVEEDQYGEIFRNVEYCKSELLRARDVFGDRRTTEVEYDACERVVTMILIHGPEEIVETARATLLEMGYRRLFFERLWKPQTYTRS